MHFHGRSCTNHRAHKKGSNPAMQRSISCNLNLYLKENRPKTRFKSGFLTPKGKKAVPGDWPACWHGGGDAAWMIAVTGQNRQDYKDLALVSKVSRAQLTLKHQGRLRLPALLLEWTKVAASRKIKPVKLGSDSRLSLVIILNILTCPASDSVNYTAS